MRALIKRETKSVRRSRFIWLPSVLMVLLYFMNRTSVSNSAESQLGSDVTLALMQHSAGLVIFLTGIIGGYRAVSTERETGSIKFTQAMPITRRELVVGKVLGRCIALGAAIVPGVVAIVAIGIYRDGLFSLPAFFGLSIVTYFLLCIYISIGVGISSISKRTRMTTGTGVVVLLVHLLWENVVLSTYSILNEPISATGPEAVNVVFFLTRILPFRSYYVVTNELLGAPNSHWRAIAAIEDASSQTSTNAIVAGGVYDELPFFLTSWFAMIVLCCWVAVAVGVSTYCIRRGDL